MKCVKRVEPGDGERAYFNMKISRCPFLKIYGSALCLESSLKRQLLDFNGGGWELKKKYIWKIPKQVVGSIINDKS